MNAIDLLIVVVLALATLGGWRQGFILQVAGILGAVTALAVAGSEYGDVRQMLANLAPHSRWLTVIAYLSVFLLVWAGIFLVARHLRRAARILRLGWLDRGGGLVIGFLQGVLLAELLVGIAARVPDGAVHRAVRHAALAPAFGNVLPYIHHLLPGAGQ